MTGRVEAEVRRISVLGDDVVPGAVPDLREREVVGVRAGPRVRLLQPGEDQQDDRGHHPDAAKITSIFTHHGASR